MKKKRIISFIAIFIISFNLEAQIPSLNPVNGVLPAVMNISGGMFDIASSYYRYEWSLGELVLIQSFASADSTLLLTQGVLQPCTDKIGLSSYTVLFEAGDFKLFPNPTAGKFELDFFVKMPGRMSLQLINSMGQVVQKRSYHYDGCCRIELFDLSAQPAGVYFVVADLVPDTMRSDGIVITRHSGFKVVKINR